MMQPLLLLSCRNSVSDEVADHFGVLGCNICPSEEGCFLPDIRDDAKLLFDAVGGLRFPDLENRVPIPNIPKLVRVIPGDSNLPFNAEVLGSTAAAKYSEIGGLRTKAIDRAKVLSWRSTRNVSKETNMLFFEESKDEILERLSPSTHKVEFFSSLAAMGNVILVSPGYSVYDNGCLCEWLQLINMKRSIHFAYVANSHGLPCVPCIGWNSSRPRDLERLAQWLICQGDKVTHLAVNAQTGGPLLWNLLADGMSSLESKTKRPYHWLVFGGTNSLKSIYSHIPWPRVSLISSAVTTSTLKHSLIDHRTTVDMPQELLVIKNIELERQRREIAITRAESNIVAGYLRRCS